MRLLWFAYHAVFWGNQQTWSRLIWRGILLHNFLIQMYLIGKHCNLGQKGYPRLMILNYFLNLIVGQVYFCTYNDQCLVILFWGVEGGGREGGREGKEEEEGDSWYLMNFHTVIGVRAFLVNKFLVKDYDFFNLCYCLKEWIATWTTCNVPTLKKNFRLNYHQLMCLINNNNNNNCN